MLARFSKWAVVLALTFTLGAHWMLLQSVAWAGMVVSYSRTAPLAQALSKTFDGKHPCCLCKLVRQGKAAEKKQESQRPEVKLDPMLPAGPVPVLSPPRLSPTFARARTLPASRIETPPKPPPRLA